MTDARVTTVPTRDPELTGQTVIVIGGSSGIGYETARRASAEGAAVVVAGRDHDRAERAAHEVGATRFAAFDATDPVRLEEFFRDQPSPIDHVMVTAGRPHYGPLLEMDQAEAKRNLDEHLILILDVA